MSPVATPTALSSYLSAGKSLPQNDPRSRSISPLIHLPPANRLTSWTRFVKMTLGSYTFGWAFTVLLCFTFHSASGDCGPPPVKPNTNPVTETSGITGATVVYTCDRSTEYYEAPKKSTTITCQDDGTWTDIEDFCIRACGVPERIEFAEPNALDKDVYLPNDTVAYKCRPGYVRAPGTRNVITCLENYKWSTPEEFCNRRTCGNPGDVDNGYFDATDFLFGSRVTYTCNEGYRLSNRRNFRDCEAGGTWSNAVPQCDAVICPAPDKPADGDYYPQKDEYHYLDSVTFSCLSQLEVAGTATISCTAAGVWSAGTPTCKAVSCSDPVVDNSRKTSGFIGPYKLNSAISFECEKGFVLNGSTSIICNIDSQWEPTIPKCEKGSCGDPGSIENGQRSVSDFFFGSKATYTCNNGYAFTSSVNFRTCQENGIWTGSTPECAGISCPDPGKIKNGHVRVQNHLFGSRAIYTCEEGYVRNSTVNYRECQADGTWSRPIACTDESETRGLGGGAIAAIVISLVGAVVGCVILCICIKKKQKRGVYYCDVKADKCVAALKSDP